MQSPSDNGKLCTSKVSLSRIPRNSPGDWMTLVTSRLASQNSGSPAHTQRNSRVSRSSSNPNAPA